MKKIILLIAVLSISVLSNAQRINDLGLKMVKEFTLNKYEKGILKKAERYVYEYDDNNRMVAFKKYIDGELEEFYSNINGKIDYQNRYTQYNKCKYNITLDRYGNITFFEYIQLDYEKPQIPCWKKNFKFHYIFEEENKVFRLDEMSSIAYNYSRSKGDYLWHDKYNISKLVEEDGLLISPNVKRYVVDKAHPNDTNVSFYGLINPNMSQSSGLISSFFLTEWINVRSNYFCIENWTWKHLEYVYDDKGNLIKIEDRDNDDNRLVREFIIEYVN